MPNSAYLVKSSSYDNGLIVDAGAVTFGGLVGARGTITAANSDMKPSFSNWCAVASRPYAKKAW